MPNKWDKWALQKNQNHVWGAANPEGQGQGPQAVLRTSGCLLQSHTAQIERKFDWSVRQ